MKWIWKLAAFRYTAVFYSPISGATWVYTSRDIGTLYPSKSLLSSLGIECETFSESYHFQDWDTNLRFSLLRKKNNYTGWRNISDIFNFLSLLLKVLSKNFFWCNCVFILILSSTILWVTLYCQSRHRSNLLCLMRLVCTHVYKCKENYFYLQEKTFLWWHFEIRSSV